MPMLILALLVVHLVLGVLCLAAARRDERLEAVRYWGWGLLATAGGILLTLSAPWLGHVAAFALGNSLVSYAPIPLAQSVMTHTGRRFGLRWAWAVWVLVVAVLCWNSLFGPQLRAVNLWAPSVLLAALYSYGGFALLRWPVVAAKSASRLMAGIMIASGAFLILRAIVLGNVVDDPHSREQAALLVDLSSIVQIVVAMIGMMGLFWIEVLKMEHTLKTMAYGDPLTGLANRRATMMRFEEMLSLARRSRQPLALAVFDVDFFKKVNDAHGHGAGDLVLKHVSALLADAKRQEDLLGRVGGEEFVLLLPNTHLTDGHVIADRIRDVVAAFPAPTQPEPIAVTLSGGVAAFPEDGENWDQIFAAADRRLYRSKSDGRNRVSVVG